MSIIPKVRDCFIIGENHRRWDPVGCSAQIRPPSDPQVGQKASNEPLHAASGGNPRPPLNLKQSPKFVTVQIWGKRTGCVVPCGCFIGVKTAAKREKNGHKARCYSVGGVTVNSYLSSGDCLISSGQGRWDYSRPKNPWYPGRLPARTFGLF